MTRSPEIDPLARVAAVDWEAYEREALDAVTGAGRDSVGVILVDEGSEDESCGGAP